MSTLMRCYSDQMFETLSKIAPNLKQVSFYFDERLLVDSKQKNEKIKIIYASSRDNNDYLQNLFLEDLKKILIDYSNKIEMYFWGPPPEDPSLLDLKNCSHLPFEQNYEAFIENFKNMNFDIGLAPMMESAFFNSKTNNKYREYGGCKIAGIYSKTKLYSSVSHEETGLLCDNSPGSWSKEILKLINNSELRNKITQNAYLDIKNNYSLSGFQETLYEDLVKSIEWGPQKNQKTIGFPPKIFIFSDSGVSTNTDNRNLLVGLKNSFGNFESNVCSSLFMFKFFANKDSLCIAMAENLEWLLKKKQISSKKSAQFIGFLFSNETIPSENRSYIHKIGALVRSERRKSPKYITDTSSGLRVVCWGMSWHKDNATVPHAGESKFLSVADAESGSAVLRPKK